MSDVDFVNCLAGVYEHSPWVAKCVCDSRPFSNPEELYGAMQRVVNEAQLSAKLTLIRAHPELAGKATHLSGLTDDSAREQVGLGLDRLNARAAELFARKNLAYRQRFGFPFIICVRKSTQEGVLEAFERRMENSDDQEIEEALRQIHEIAGLRIEDIFVQKDSRYR